MTINHRLNLIVYQISLNSQCSDSFDTPSVSDLFFFLEVNLKVMDHCFIRQVDNFVWNHLDVLFSFELFRSNSLVFFVHQNLFLGLYLFNPLVTAWLHYEGWLLCGFVLILPGADVEVLPVSRGSLWLGLWLAIFTVLAGTRVPLEQSQVYVEWDLHHSSAQGSTLLFSRAHKPL